MKKVCLLFVLVLLSFSTNAQQPVEKIKAVLNQQVSDWNKGDLTAYMQGYWNSDSLVFIGKNGPKYGWKATLAGYQKSYPNKATMGTLHFSGLKIEMLSAHAAFVQGQWYLEREKDKLGGSFTLLVKKIKGQWLIVVDHSS